MTMLLLRLLHIVLGALWVGIAVFLPFYLMPSLGEAGPESAGKVMAGLQKRNVPVLLPIAALLTLVSGFLLYWKVSAGFTPDFMGSPTGIALGTGGLLATVAFVIGVAVARPSMIRVATLSQQLRAASEADRPQLLATIEGLRRRGAVSGQVVAVLLLLTLALMAVARYL